MSKRNYILAGFAVIALALGIWWLAGSGTAPEPAPSSPEAGKAAPGVLPVDRRQAAQLGIRLAPALTATWGETATKALGEAIADLKFGAALTTLENLRRSRGCR